MKPVKWLLVGAGDIARKRVAPALSQAEGSILAAVCDPRLDSARAIAGPLPACQVFTDYAGALAQSDAEAVYLATPVYLHVDQLLQALQSGKHVLVEKPLGLTGEECRRALAAVRQPGQRTGCAYYRRLYPAYLQARAMHAAGEFGQVLHVGLTYYSWFDPQPADPKYWRVERAKSGGGPLSDMGTHMFDVLIGLFGLPRKVFARCDNLLHAWDVEDTAAILMQLANGARVTAFFSWSSKTWRHELEIVGREARVSWLPFDSGQVTRTVGRNTETLQLPPAANVHLPVVQDFIDAIHQDRPPVCPLEEAAKTNLLLDAVYQSARQGAEVELKD